jgi:hypothetical protein
VDEVPELMNDATGREARPPALDNFAAEFPVFVGHNMAISQGQCLAMGMSFSEREKNLFAGHLFGDFLSWRA